ncbi:hypothetical protein OB917_27315 [Klebsiella variicola]|nr:hypothetical protein [Klebsiella variicola]
MKNNDFLLEWQKVDVKSECLYSLLTVMGLSLSEAEEDDIKKMSFHCFQHRWRDYRNLI